MGTESNKQVFRRVIDEVFNQGKYSSLPELFNADFVEHQFGLHATYAGMQADLEQLRKSFPDFKLTIDDIIAEGDMVWARMTARGTNSVGFMGPPNGKTFQIAVFDTVRLEDDRIVEHWGSPDRFAMLAQLGLLPQNAPTSR